MPRPWGTLGLGTRWVLGVVGGLQQEEAEGAWQLWGPCRCALGTWWLWGPPWPLFGDMIGWLGGDPLCPVDASWGCGGCFGDTPPSTALGTQGYGNASWRYLHGRSVQVTKEEEWLWFDVTDVVKQWLSSSGKSGGGGLVPVSPPPQPHAQGPPMALLTTPRNPAESLGMFKLSVHCPCEQGPGATNNMRITIEGTAVLGGGVCVGSPVSPSPVPALLPTGFEQQRGDMQGIAKKRRRVPYVLAMSLPPDRANDLHSSRRRRALDAEYCFGSAPPPPPSLPRKDWVSPQMFSSPQRCSGSS